MADVNRTVMIMIKGNADKLNKALSDSKSGFAKFAKGVAVAGAAVSAMALGIAKLNQQVADMVNQLVDASTKTGIAVESLSALKLAAEGSGRSFQDIEGGLIRFQQSMAMAAEGTGRQAEAFADLGIKVQKTDGSMRSSNEVFGEAIEKLKNMGEGTERNIKVMELFGRNAGAALTQSGAIDAFDQYLDRVNRYGVDVGPKAREEAAAWQRAVADMSMVTSRALQDIVTGLTGGRSLATALTETTGAFIFMKSIAADVFNAISKTLTAVIGNITAGIVAIGRIDFSKMASAVLLMSQPMTMLKGLQQLQGIGENLRKTATDLNSANSKFANEALDNAGNMLSRAKEARKEFVAGAKISGSGFTGGNASRRAKASAAAAKGQKKDILDLAKLREEVDAISSRSQDKLLTKEQRIEKEYGAQISRLREIQTISKEKIDTLREQSQLQIDMETQLEEVREENAKREQKRADERKKEEQEALQRRINNINSYGKAFTGYMSSFASAVKTTMENGGKLTEERAQSLHKLQQKVGVGEVWINAAVATMKAYAQFGLIGGIPAAVAMSALATAQTAAIMSQPPPKFHKGGFVDGADVVNAQLLKGEAVLDRQTVREIGGARGVQQIGQKPQVVVVNSFKHFDRFLAASMRENTRIRNLVPASSGRIR